MEPSNSAGRIQTRIGTEYNNGWAELTWTDADHLISYQQFDLLGLPAVGFAAVQFENGTIEGGILANYASAHQHKFDKTVSAGD